MPVDESESMSFNNSRVSQRRDPETGQGQNQDRQFTHSAGKRAVKQISVKKSKISKRYQKGKSNDKVKKTRQADTQRKQTGK